MSRFGTDFCVRRREWVSDEAWYGSRFYKEVLQHADWDFAIYSQIGITPPGVVDGLSVARPLGRPDFTLREVAMVKLIHRELARVWRNDASLPVHTLPPRQRQVLEGIRQGHSRKKIAESLKLSQHTVHSYEKALFTFANVASRAELVAILNKTARPALMP
jgi:DNA-binding CsgD family transcriptional regulator